ncbi:MAG: pantothenate kinase [Leptolyngbyaceae bacterium]|nr:pantothenate kinase [Leptolyngbyaceae bacterium]
MRLALVIGNSRLHWAVLSERRVYATWDTEPLDRGAIAPLCSRPDPLNSRLTLAPSQELEQITLTPPLIIVSVVPQQTAFWQRHISCDVITLEQIPLRGLYPTMGIDRAIAALGAGETYGFPVLVIDGGTALTLTGIDGDRRVIGGAILPGLRLQGRSLNQHTAALPEIDFASPSSSPASAIPRWAVTTPDAIRSGIFYTILSGIRDFVEDWRVTHVDSRVVLTGGDGEFLYRHLGDRYPQMKPLMSFEPHLVFKGIQTLLTKKCPEP